MALQIEHRAKLDLSETQSLGTDIVCIEWRYVRASDTWKVN